MAFTYPPATGLSLDKVAEYAPWFSIGPFGLSDTDGPFTVDFMVRLDATLTESGGVISTIIREGVWTGAGFNFYLRPTAGEQLAFVLYGTYVRAGDITEGVWTQITCVYAGLSAGGEMTLYADGVALGTATQASDANFNTGGEFTAYHNGTHEPAPVTMANLRVWDHAKTATEVNDLQGTSHPDEDAGLLLEYAFDQPDVYVNEVSAGVFALHYGGEVDYEGAGVSSVESEPNPVAFPGSDNLLGLNTVTPPQVAAVESLVGSSSEDVEYAGQISGVVTVKGDPAAQRVLAFVRSTGKKVAETTSAEDGTYTLSGLDPDVAHYVVALDKNLEYNGVIADNIVPEVPA